MYNDYIELCCLINAWDAYNKDHRERSRSELRQLLVDMADKGPEHLIGVFSLYLKTHQSDKDL
jgi:hypothetical protein